MVKRVEWNTARQMGDLKTSLRSCHIERDPVWVGAYLKENQVKSRLFTYTVVKELFVSALNLI